MQFKRTLAALLAMVMLVSLLPAAVFAEDFDEPVIEDVDLPVEEAPEIPAVPAAPEETDPPTLPSPEPDPETPDETKPDPQDDPGLELEELREVPQDDEDTLTEIPKEGYSGTCGDNVSWALDDSGTLTISGSGAMKDYYAWDDAPWYSYRSSVKKVVIQQGVTSIGGYAFSGCSNLTSVTIPDSVSSIGWYAFYDCSSLTSLSISSLEAWCRISFGSSSSNPLSYASDSKTKSVFLNGEPLTQVVVPDGFTMIPDYAFRGWNTITSVTIPDSVSSIGDFAFAYCSSLTSITIPDSVSSIGIGAFYYCSSLTSVSIPDSVSSIGSAAFEGCSSLTSVSIPDSVTSIGGNAFLECSSLTSITIPDSVSSIGSYAFFGCSSLSSVSIGNGVSSIGEHAFAFCSSLTSLYISSLEAWCRISFGNFSSNPLYYVSDSKTNSVFLNGEPLTQIIVPDGVTMIPAYAFNEWNTITSVSIPDSVSSIGSAAFDRCSSLTSVNIPDSVTSIGDYAFAYCSSLTSVSIPDSVSSIGDYAFDSCSSLTSVTIPDSVSSIGEAAFQCCSSLTSVSIPDSVFSIGSFAFEECSSLTSVTIPDSVSSIGSNAFAYCSSLTSVSIPDSVSSIGIYAFSHCSSLTSVSIPDSVSSIGDSAFWDCSSLNTIRFEGAAPQCVGESTDNQGNTVLVPRSPNRIFGGVTATVYYPENEPSWTAEERAKYQDGNLTWVPYAGTPTSIKSVSVSDNMTVQLRFSRDILGGDNPANYTVTNPNGQQVSVASAAKINNREYRLTFASPLAPGTYSIRFSGEFIADSAFNIEAPKVTFVSIDTLNNQCIRVAFSQDMLGGDNKGNYTVTDSNGNAVSIGAASKISGNVYQLNFSDPMKAGGYNIRFAGEHVVNGTFEILLDLSVYRIIDSRHVIIQLSDAIMGCTDAPNYSFHNLKGDTINIIEAVSAFAELGGEAPNVFKLTTDRDLQAGTTYVVETKNMFQNGRPCQGTIAYFTPESFGIAAEVTALTNNQSIKIRLPKAVTGADVAANYVVKNSAGQEMPVGNVQVLGSNQYEVNFADPLKADHYTISSRNMSEQLTGSFDITLDLRVVGIEENSVIIQLNEPIYGCTDAPNYFVHKLGMNQEITATSAVSVFAELGGALPNVFRITLPERIVVGQTYIIETRGMSLDVNWEHPCQGTIAYFTK